MIEAKIIIPPDPEEMNDARAEWAEIALRAFQKKTGTDDEDMLYDLICDLRHWADRAGVDFVATLRALMECYVEETTAWPRAEGALTTQMLISHDDASEAKESDADRLWGMIVAAAKP